jgi:hypothetical protein
MRAITSSRPDRRVTLDPHDRQPASLRIMQISRIPGYLPDVGVRVPPRTHALFTRIDISAVAVSGS